MIRNLKALLLAALAVTAFGAFASVAQAAEFTAPGAAPEAVTKLDLKTDGSGKTSHHVFIIGNETTESTVSFTCEDITGSPTVTGSATPVVRFVPGYTGCSAAGQAVTVNNTGCEFVFLANKTVEVVGANCKHGGTPIDVTFTGCKVEVGAQVIANAIQKYHNVEGRITVEPFVLHKIVYNSEGAACNYGTRSNGSYTTGNTLIEGTRPEGTKVEVKWDA